MTKYNQTSVAGESWRRSPQIFCYNNYNEPPVIAYDEEDIIVSSDGKYATSRMVNRLVQQFTPENANTEFQLKNPSTEEYTGKTATYYDLYVMLHSLYFHLAKERDKGPQPYPSWSWSEETNSWVAPIPKPYASWFWDEETGSWNAPTEKPEDGQDYIWDESTRSWKI